MSVVTIGCLLAASRQAAADEVFWLPAGTSNFNTPTNWERLPAGSGNTGAPLSLNNESAVIINGGTAEVNSTVANNPGSVRLGAATVNLLAGSGTLRILPGGNLTAEFISGAADANGVVVVGAAVTNSGVTSQGVGTFEMTGGTLNAAGITLGGATTSAVRLSGNATLNLGVTPAFTSTFGRDFRITGPNVNFTSTNNVTLQAGGGAGRYTAEITAATHSPIKTTGTATLAGNLNIAFTGFTPTPGTSTWTLVDAATLTGNFANAALGGVVPNSAVTGYTPPVGATFALSNVAGGNGRRVQLSLDKRLVMQVNRDTGDITLRNPQGAVVTQLTGYSISSAAGSLISSYAGISGAGAWDRPPGNSATGIAEFRIAGAFDASSAALNQLLGKAFSKTQAVIGQGAANFGTNGEDLVFEYTTFGGTSVVRGLIEYVGTPFYNDVILNVTTAGLASIKNDTTVPVAIDGYSIVSSTGALSGAAWDSLEDKTAARFDGWRESPATTGALSETNPDHPLNPLVLAPGESVSLGDIGDFSSAAAQAGLTFKYILGNGATTGDFDGDGDGDGNDFILAQRQPSVTAAIGRAVANYGKKTLTNAPENSFRLGQVKVVTSLATAVPEPATGALGLFIAAAAAACCRPRHPHSRREAVHESNAGQKSRNRTSEASNMTGSITRLAAAALAVGLAVSSPARAAVNMTASSVQPTVGAIDQANTLDGATIPGNTPFPFNSQAFSDNAGPPGQTFTTPTAAFTYSLTSFSYKGANTGGGNSGGNVFTAGTTWGVRVSLVSGTTLVPIKTVTAIPTTTTTVEAITPVGTEWYTWTFTDADIPVMGGGSTYAFEAFSSAGYLGFDADTTQPYLGGTAFNSNGAARSFAGTTLQTRAYDRTFIAKLTASSQVAGDINNSGAADIDDYHIIRQNLEKPVTAFTNGDLNGDSFVDLNDFRMWTNVAPPAVVANLGVPEPSAIALGAAAAASLVWFRRRSRRSRARCADRNSAAPLARVALAALTIGAAASTASAQSLGLNFASDDPSGEGGSALADSDVAGVVPAPHWNNLQFSNGSQGGLFYNNAGTAVASNVNVTWSSPNTWRSGTVATVTGNNAFPVGPNRTLLTGYLDSTDQSDGGVSITISGIDAALRSPAYDVYVYFVSDSNANRGGAYTLADGTSSTIKYGSTQGSPSTFLEDPGTDQDLSVDGNYLRFRGLTATSFTLTTDASLTNPNGFRAPVNAIQIVGGVPIGPPGPGDVNEDLVTNTADYNIIKANFWKTTGVTRQTGDLNQDGRVSLADYLLWRNNVPLSGPTSGVGVPEPGSVALAVAAAAALALAARRRGSVC
jgi:hypothetical protein